MIIVYLCVCLLFYAGDFSLCPAGKIFAKSGTGPWVKGRPPPLAHCPILFGRGAWGFLPLCTICKSAVPSPDLWYRGQEGRNCMFPASFQPLDVLGFVPLVLPTPKQGQFSFIPGHRLASSPQWRRGQLCQWLGQLCLGVCAEPGGQVRLMGFRGLDGEHCPPNALPLSGAGQSSSFLHPGQRLWRLPTLFKSGDKVMRNLVETPHQRDKKSHSPHLSLPARKGQEWGPGRRV